MKSALVALFSLFFALSLFAKTYKNTYPLPCSEVWPAVKDTLSNPDNYTVKESDDAQMKASYDVKHAVHVTVTGIFLQRTNHVTLKPKGGGCEMDVVSNFSGWEHDDQADFKKRVDDSLAKLKSAKPAEAPKPAEPAKPADAPKPAESAKPSDTPQSTDTPKSVEPAKPADAPKPAPPGH